MKRSLAVTCVLLLLFGCAEQKYDIGKLLSAAADTTGHAIGDTVYVQQNPEWRGFNHPRSIIVGNEPLIYVADTDNNRIAMLDLFGHIIGYSKPIQRPIGLAEDKNLNLVICAQFDTTLPGRTTPTTFGALYRIDLFSAGHDIKAAPVKRVFYEPSDSVRRYTGIAMLYNNSYYVTRIGNKNEPERIDKDIAILEFDENDNFVTPIPGLTPDGTGLQSLDSLTGIATIPTGKAVDFVYCQSGTKSLLKVQWIYLKVEGQTTNFVSKFDPLVDPTLDILKVNRFTSPAGVTIDPSSNLFVVDAVRDSLYRFSASGVEKYSFGGPKQFNQPHGVAFSNRTLYIADTGNNRIVRFKLSTDIQ